jgi:hypothetical protein
MKILLAATAFILCSNLAFSQKCEEKSDPISGEKRVEFKDRHWSYTTMSMVLSNSSLQMTKPFYYEGVLQGKVPAGTEIIFKLEDGEIVVLKTISDVVGTPEVADLQMRTQFDLIFELTKEQVHKLSKSPIVLIRRPKLVAEGTEDLGEKDLYLKRTRSAIQKGASCMITHM